MLRISVAPSKATAIVKMSGSIEPGDSVSAFSILNDVIFKDYNRVIVDLGDCEDMDSTFMGMLVVICERRSKNRDSFTLLNVGADNMRAFKRLGIAGMIPIRRRQIKEPLAFVDMDLEVFRGAPGDRISIMETTHRALVEANEQNAERFGSFLRLLEAEKNLP